MLNAQLLSEIYEYLSLLITLTMTPTAFLVGTMAQVSQRIGELDRSLQDYTQLVFDSRLSEHEDTTTTLPFSPGSSSVASAKHKRRGQC